MRKIITILILLFLCSPIFASDIIEKEWLKVANEYYNLNNFEKSIEIYNKVLDNNPKNNTALKYLGYCYNKIENNEKALEYLQKSYDISVDYDVKKKIEEINNIVREKNQKANTADLKDSSLSVKVKQEEDNDTGSKLQESGTVVPGNWEKFDFKYRIGANIGTNAILAKEVISFERDGDLINEWANVHIRPGFELGIENIFKFYSFFSASISLKCKLKWLKWDMQDELESRDAYGNVSYSQFTYGMESIGCYLNIPLLLTYTHRLSQRLSIIGTIGMSVESLIYSWDRWKNFSSEFKGSFPSRSYDYAYILGIGIEVNDSYAIKLLFESEFNQKDSYFNSIVQERLKENSLSLTFTYYIF